MDYSKEKIRIAYLISAHTDPKQLRRLINALSFGVEDFVEFFVHVDAKVDEIPFKKECNLPNVHFCPNRYWIQWGGYSQTLYQRELLRCALEAESNVFQFARFVIITGLDYPLISNLRMLKWYQIHPNEQLMMGANLTKCSPERLVMYQFLRDTKFRNPLYQRIASAVCRRIMKVIPIRRKPYIQLGCQRWDIWQSSAYMSLTHDCAKFVFDMMGKKEVIHFFRYTFAPDEKMIPTIIFNSEYGKNLQKLDKYQSLISVSAMVHFDYGKSIKIYSEGDYEGLIHSEKMFCRKVVTGYSDKLLDLLDKHNGVQTH